MTNLFTVWLVLLAGFYFAYAFGARVAAARLAAAQGTAPPLFEAFGLHSPYL